MSATAGYAFWFATTRSATTSYARRHPAELREPIRCADLRRDDNSSPLPDASWVEHLRGIEVLKFSGCWGGVLPGAEWAPVFASVTALALSCSCTDDSSAWSSIFPAWGPLFPRLKKLTFGGYWGNNLPGEELAPICAGVAELELTCMVNSFPAWGPHFPRLEALVFEDFNFPIGGDLAVSARAAANAAAADADAAVHAALEAWGPHLGGLKRLEFIDCPDFARRGLPGGAWADSLAALETLTIINCELRALPAWRQSLARLQELVVDSNPLGRLPPEWGEFLGGLVRLICSNISLELLPPWRLPRLQYLCCANNALQVLSDGWADNVADLRHLDCSENDLVRLPASWAEGARLDRLEVLNCTINSFEDDFMPVGWRKTAETLTTFACTECYGAVDAVIPAEFSRFVRAGAELVGVRVSTVHGGR
jgi:hypothetical protein